MEVFVTLDSDWESGISINLASVLWEPLAQFFESKSYGEGVKKVAIILTCRPSYLNFKVRKRFEKATKTLYYDVMLNFEAVKEMPVPEKKKAVHQVLQDSIELVMGYKKKIMDFDFDTFRRDWKKFFWEFEWDTAEGNVSK